MTDPKTLDRILELQFIVAWAGEANAEPPRQPWWRTNWVDEYGGHDLLSRMVPRTADWAQYEMAREAARRVDYDGLAKQANADRIRTLFYLGPDLDAELRERLLDHKRSEEDPLAALPGLKATKAAWDGSAFEGYLSDLGEPRNFTSEPFGQRLTGDAPEEPIALVRTLAQGLVPLKDQYPRPYAVAE